MRTIGLRQLRQRDVYWLPALRMWLLLRLCLPRGQRNIRPYRLSRIRNNPRLSSSKSKSGSQFARFGRASMRQILSLTGYLVRFQLT